MRLRSERSGWSPGKILDQSLEVSPLAYIASKTTSVIFVRPCSIRAILAADTPKPRSKRIGRELDILS